MNIKLISILLCLFCVPLTSCGGEDEPASVSAQISVSSETLTFSGVGGEQAITVDTNHEWGTYASDSWIKVSPESSTSHKASITIAVQENTKTSPREGSVTIMSGAARKTIVIKQEAGEHKAPIYDCPEGYQLVWHDEFDQGVSLGKDWTHEVQRDHWVNNELQNYVKERTPNGSYVTEIIDGALHINCIKENGKVYSGRVYAKVNEGWQFGYIEARIKLPKGKGTWPAFWMMPVHVDWATEGWPKCGEIDIMEEVGYHPNYVSSSLHAEGHYHVNNTQVTKEVLCPGAEDDYHIYAMEWTEEYFQFYVDGKKTLYYANDGKGVRNWPYSKPYYVILNLAWGGDWGGNQGVDEKALPATMKVDYVRVFQK